MSFEAVDFYLVDTTPQARPVAGVTLKLFSLDGKIVYGMGATDSSGHAGFLLPSGGPYQVRFFRFGTSVPQPQLFSVLPSPVTPPQSNAFTVPVSVLAPPVPQDGRLCTAFGFFRDMTGAPLSGVQMHVIAEFDPVWLDGAAVLKERVIFATDEKGYAQVNLIRNGYYLMTVQGEEDISRRIRVPDAPNVNLPDLIFPVVSAVVTDPPGPFTLTVGQSLTVDVSVYASDGEDLHLGIGDVHYRSSSQQIVSFSMAPPSSLVLYGGSPGTAQIDLTRANRSIIRIPDCGIEGNPLSVTVTAP